MRLILLILLLFVSGDFARTLAAPAVFAVDPTRSQIMVAGSLVGTALQDQGPGSLTASFGGTILVDVTGTTIRFTGGSGIDAVTNGVWEPNIGGGSGTAPADFAGKAQTFLATAKGAFRNVLLDVSSPALPLLNGEFNASALQFGFPASSTAALDYNAGFFAGSLPLTGYATNEVTDAGSLKLVAGVQTLTIRVNTQYRFTALSANDSSVRLTGQLVATPAQILMIESVALVDKKIKIVVPELAASLQIQSSTNLTQWQNRLAVRETSVNATIFTLDPSTGVEFFRAMK